MRILNSRFGQQVPQHQEVVLNFAGGPRAARTNRILDQAEVAHVEEQTVGPDTVGPVVGLACGHVVQDHAQLDFVHGGVVGCVPGDRKILAMRLDAARGWDSKTYLENGFAKIQG